MGAIRITRNLLIDRVLTDLNDQTRRLLDLQRQLATGQRVNIPSDDPLAARRAVSARSVVSRNEQFLTNISSIGPTLNDSEAAVLTTVDALRRARELTLQGANEVNSQTQLDEIANEINEILESVFVQANTATNDRFIFGGTRTLEAPFEATRDANGDIVDVTYQGNDEQFQVEISAGVNVDVNEPGSAVFGTPANPQSTEVLQVLIDTRDNLLAGNRDALQTRLGEFSEAEDQLLVVTSRLGAVQRRLERVESNLRDQNVQLQEVVSDNLDADFAEVTVNLNAETNAFRAALNAAGRVIQPSLIDFVQ